MSEKKIIKELKKNNDLLEKLLASVNNVGLVVGLGNLPDITDYSLSDLLAGAEGIDPGTKSEIENDIASALEETTMKLLFEAGNFYYDEETDSIFFIKNFELDIREGVECYICDAWLENKESDFINCTVMFPARLVDAGKLVLADVDKLIVPRLGQQLANKGYGKGSFLDAVTGEEHPQAHQMRLKWNSDGTCMLHDFVTGGIMWHSELGFGGLAIDNKYTNSLGDTFVLGSDAAVFFGFKEDNTVVVVSCEDIKFEDFSDCEEHTEGFAHGWQALKHLEENK